SMTGDGYGPGVRHVGKECAQRYHHLHAKRFREVDQVRAEGTPAQRGLDALNEHKIAGGSRRASLEDLDGGPHDLARAALAEPDAGTVGLEVVELLRVDLREAGGSERGGEERGCAGGGVSSVVPAPEGAHHRWGPEAIRTAIPDEGLHPNHRT